MKRLILVVVAAVVAPAASDYFPPPDSKGGWRSLTSASDAELLKKAGMDRAKLDAAFEFAKDTTQHGGLVVVRHGWLVYEKYFGRADRNANPDMASCGKAFTSIAMGIALKEKHSLIPQGLDTKVFTDRYLPEAFPLDDPRQSRDHARAALIDVGGLSRRRDAARLQERRAHPARALPAGAS